MRRHPREQVMRRGAIVHEPTGRSYSCVIVDVSLGGARLQLFAPDLPSDGLNLVDARRGTVHELRVAWRSGPFVGVAFVGTKEAPKPT
jgi:hypothetical protein